MVAKSKSKRKLEEEFKLNDKQRRFCEEYIIDLNPGEAYIRAGYSPNGARQSANALLNLPSVRKYLKQLMTEVKQECIINAAYVLKNIKDIGERCMQKEKVVDFNQEKRRYEQKQDEENNNVWEFDAGNALRAQELLGKHLKLFTDKVIMDVNDSLGEDIAKARKRAMDDD